MMEESLPTPTSTAALPKSSILIVDDEPGVLRQIERDLAVEDFHILTANSGEEALNVLQAQEVQVIVTDQKMGNGMLGTAFLTEARKLKPQLVGIVLSAYCEAKYVLQALNEARAFFYLLKPWNKNELIDCLNRALQLSRSGSLESAEQRLHHLSLLERCHSSERNLKYTQDMLTQALHQLYQSEADLREAARALHTFSDVSEQLFGQLNRKLRERAEV